MKTEKKSYQVIAVLLLVVFAVFFAGCTENVGPRRIINLDGTWAIAEGDMDSIPQQFTHSVPVPGLV
jgi:hypothetical protein